MREKSLLAVLVALGFGLRWWALGFGLPSWLHPDEFRAVFIPLGFFGGDLNPHFFNYPTLQYYLLGLVYWGYFALQKIGGAGLSFDQFVALHYFWDRVDLMYLARLVNTLFGCGTLIWTWVLATQIYGTRAAWSATALMTVCSLHVRQCHLAGVDVPLTFWFSGAVWAAIRLLERNTSAAYALAGVLVGLAGATKYPGVLAGSAVIAAHLLTRRSLLDKRLWIAGGVALACFILASPYVLIDWTTFLRHFLSELEHLETGHGQDLGVGWWYHLKVSLPSALGWLALLLAGANAVWALKERRSTHLILLAVVLIFYLVIGWGHTVFVRYMLPLTPLLAVLTGGFLARIPRAKYLTLALVGVCAQPMYASWRTLLLLDTPDTRVQARAWVERQIPEGTVIGNFGGWAGDVQVLTFEELWHHISHFELVFGREKADAAIDFLERQPIAPPFYSNAIQRNNILSAPGSIETVEQFKPGVVVLHRHPLEYSHTDSAFVAALSVIAEPMVHFTPSGLESKALQYDPLDAFYVPLDGFGALAQPGPEVEIWRMKEVTLPQTKRLSVRALFARGYADGAADEVSMGKLYEAKRLAFRAIQLDQDCAEAYLILAILDQQKGQLKESLTSYYHFLRRDSTSAAHLRFSAWGLHQAVATGEEVLRLNPDNVDAHRVLFHAYRILGQPDKMKNHEQEALRLGSGAFPESGQ